MNFRISEIEEEKQENLFESNSNTNLTNVGVNDKNLENTVSNETAEEPAVNSAVNEGENKEENLIDEDAVIEEKTEQANKEQINLSSQLDVKVVADDEISLNNIVEDTKIEVNLEYVQGENLNIEDLFKNIKIQLSGKYINSDLKEVDIGKEEEISIGWKYSKDISLESEYTKFSPFEIGEIKGTIVENKITVKRDVLEMKYLPLKSTKLEVSVPKVNGKLPIEVDVVANKLLATTGEDTGYTSFSKENWKYDESGNIVILVNNEQTAGLARNTYGADEYIIVYRYEDYVSEENSHLDNIVKATVEEYSAKENNILTKEINDKQSIQVDVGELITYSINSTEEKINKAKVYANYNSEVPMYETLYTTQVNVNILTSDILEELKIDSSKEYYQDSNGVQLEAQGIEYKSIKFSYAEIVSILSEGGEIVITNTNGEVLYILNSSLIQKEEDCTISLNGENGIIVYARNIAKNGTINFELTKAIKKCNYDKAEFKNITQIESRITAEVKYQAIDERLALQTIGTRKDFVESFTSANLLINKESLSTVKSNEDVELKIELNNDKETSDLYVNPTFELVFPKYVKNVSVENINLLYENGLKVSDFHTYTDSDIVKMRIELEGTQTSFSESTLTNGTNIIVTTNIEVDDYTPAKEDQIKLYYYNQGVSNYESQTKWTINKEVPAGILKTTNGFDVALINYQAPNGLVAINGIVNYDGNLSSVKSVKQGEATRQIPINSDARIATMELLTLNNTGNNCTDVVLLGRIPFKDNKDVITLEDLGTTTDTRMIDLIKEDVENKNMVTIYYSSNPNANKNLDDIQNGWTTSVSNISEIKSYLIVVKGTVEPGQVLRYTYDFEIPANLPYETQILGSFGGFYNNNSQYAVIYESSIADRVGLTTEKGPQIEAYLSADVENTADIGECKYITYNLQVTNTGSVIANNVNVNIDVPEYASACEYNYNNGYGNNQYVLSAKPQFIYNISTLAPGEKQDYKFVIKTSQLPTLEEYNNKFYGRVLSKDEQGYYYIEEVEIPIEEENGSTNLEDKKKEIPETEEKKIYVDFINILPDVYISVKAKVEAGNLGIIKESNEIKNKLVDSKFDIVVNTPKLAPMEATTESFYTASIRNISGQDLKNVKAVWTLPEVVEFVSPENDNSQFGKNENWEYDSSTRTATKIFPEFSKDDSESATIKIKVIRGSNETIPAYLTLIDEEGNREKSSDIVVKYLGPKIDVSQITNITSGTVLEGENVEFIIQIKNIGNGDGKNLVVRDKISPNLEDVKAKSDNYGTVVINDREISYQVSNLPAGKSDILRISGRAADLNGEDKVILNKAQVSYNISDIAETNEIKIAIKENIPRREEEDKNKNDQDNNSNNSNNGNTNDSSSNNNNNNNTNNSSNNTNNPNQTQVNTDVKKQHNISGNVWLDKNRNGRKDEEENALMSVVVQLYQNNSMLKTTVTDGNGYFKFSGINQGEYFIVFQYDVNKYMATGYQKANVEENLNSKAIETSSGTATTNKIVMMDTDINNINLGLQERQKFDLSVEKVISKVKVNTNNKKEEELKFEDESLAKVEIKAKDLNKSVVELEYKIKIINIGDAEGKAETIADIMPNDTYFDETKNSEWSLGTDRVLYNNSLKDEIIKPGETKELKLVLTKNMSNNNTGVVSNIAQLVTTYTPNGLLENTENNIATQETLILVKTGYELHIIIIIITTLIIVLAIVNKDKILKININKKILKKKYR